MTLRATPKTMPAMTLLLLAAVLLGACGSDSLPGFANPPPIDGGAPDGSDDDAGEPPDDD